MLDTDTKRRIDTARDILVGKVPDPKSQVEQITIALIYKFMDDMDAEARELGGERSFFTGEFEKYGWSNLMAPGMGGHDVLNLYSEGITRMNENAGIPLLFREIFKNAYLPYRDPETLKSFLKIIDDFEYDHSERLGDAFEYLLSVLGSQGDAGQFRTPRHIIDFMVEVMDPKKDETIIDPACGTAGFLISSYKHILKSNAKDGKAGAGLTPDERAQLAENIKGYDISPDMVRLSLVNLYLHGFTNPHIYEYDTLTSEDRWNEYANVTLANPPFMSPKGGIKPHKRFSVQSKRSEVLFVDYMAEHLTPNGRAAIIVPEGIIFQSGSAYKQLRKMLVEDYLFAVVSLPSGVFNPYAGVKTSILFIDKTLAKKSDSILFVKIENDGFDLGAQRREIKKNNLPDAVKLIVDYKSRIVNGESFEVENRDNVLLVEKEKIGENGDWNLSGERYRENDKLRISDYEIVELGDVCKPEYGFTDRAQDSGDVRFIRITDISSNGELIQNDMKFIQLSSDSKKYLLNKGDLLVARTGATFGKTMIFKENYQAVFASFLIRLNFNPETILPYYYWIFAQSDNYWNQANQLMTGGGQPQFNGNAIKQLKIPLPPLEIQKEIVAEIEGYQKIIDGARAVVENYNPHIQIDPEWEMVELGEVLSFVSSGSTPKGGKDVYENAGILFIRSQNILVGKYDLSDVAHIPIKIHEEMQRSKVKKHDVFLNITGASIGRSAYFDLNNEANVNQHVAILRTKEILIPQYLSHFLNSKNGQNQIFALQSGASREALNYSQIKQMKIPLPSLETQNHIVARIEKEQALVNANKELITIFEQKINDKIASVWGE